MAPRLDNSNNITALPMIVRYLGCRDHGPCDDGATASCPHCGSDGRYVHSFVCEDGNTYGAMSGCLKHFPISRIAQEDMKLTDKEKELVAKGWKLNSWQRKMRETIDAVYAGTLDKDEALRVIDREKAKQAAYRQAKHGGRRRW